MLPFSLAVAGLAGWRFNSNMSTVIGMPSVSTPLKPADRGVVLKTYRMARHTVNEGEPLVDVRVNGHILTICADRTGLLYRMPVRVGDSVRPGDVIAEIGGLYADNTHEIFVAYRRADSPGHAGRVGERLIRDFGPWQVFKDIESLAPGRDFEEEVRAALALALVAVVVVGPRWLNLRDPFGNRRIDDPCDLHREEIRTLLNRKVHVFPVLVDGATMPPAYELPEDIRRFSKQLAIELSDSRWQYDTDRLSAELWTALAGATDRSPPYGNRT